jgi:hypothetical protein
MAATHRLPSQLVPDHTCPRCGYDQSGEIARWAEACPLLGVCSECGLEFTWSDALSAQRAKLDGFVEHGATGRIFPSAWRTWWWAISPLGFWTRVRLEHRPRIPRMVVWVALLVLLPRLVQGIAAGALYCWLFGWPRSPGTRGAAFEVVTYVFLDGIVQSLQFDQGRSRSLPFGIVCFGVSVVVIPLVLVCLPWTRERAKVYFGHVSRAATYSFAPIAALHTVWALAWIVWCVQTAWSPRGWSGMYISHYWQYWAGYGVGEKCRYIAQVLWEWGGQVAVLWLAVWWACALSRGFRIREYVPLLAVLLTCATLASLAALGYTHPMIVVGIFGRG